MAPKDEQDDKSLLKVNIEFRINWLPPWNMFHVDWIIMKPVL